MLTRGNHSMDDALFIDIEKFSGASQSNLTIHDPGVDDYYRIVLPDTGLDGALEKDLIVGGSGNDRMHGGGGNDIFTFCDNWGVDEVEQLDGGSVTLWFKSGDESKWNASELIYTDGDNSVTVKGVTSVTLRFGSEVDGDLYAELCDAKAFDAFSSRTVFDVDPVGYLANA